MVVHSTAKKMSYEDVKTASILIAQCISNVMSVRIRFLHNEIVRIFSLDDDLGC